MPPPGEPPAAAVAKAPSPPPPAPVVPQHGPAAAPQPKPSPPAPAKAPSPPPAQAAAPAATKPAAAPKPSPAPAAAPPATVAKAAPPLDLKSLEQRLKETDAIGVMTKLSLKNQVDDLLDQFRGYYAGRLNATLAELRRPFDLLVMKVLSLLQDSDPALAKAIHDSREALWAILSNRDRFAQYT